MPPRCAIGALLCLNAVALVAAVAAISAAIAVDTAGPVGSAAQVAVAWAAAIAGSGALLGLGAAAACQRHLYGYFLAQLVAAAACMWLLSTGVHAVDATVDEIGRATSWRVSAEQVLGRHLSELDACAGIDGALTEVCWHELRPSLRRSLRRSLLGWGGCMSTLQVLALLAVKWALTLPVIAVKTEIATSYLMLAAAAVLFALAIYYRFRVDTAFGRRLVWWCAGTAGLVLVLALWGFANTLLARRVGRWSSGIGGSSVACTDSCFGASRLASLAVSLVTAISLLVVAFACTSRPDSILRRVESGVTDDELQQLLYEWQLLNCRASEAAFTAERLSATPSSSRAVLLEEGRNSSFDEGVAWVGSWSGIMVGDESEIQSNALADAAAPAGKGSVLSCDVHQLSWDTLGMRPAVQSWLVADVQRVCVLFAVVLAVRLLSVGLMIYHADSPAWTVVMDGKRHHLHPDQAMEQVRASWSQFQGTLAARCHYTLCHTAVLCVLRGCAQELEALVKSDGTASHDDLSP